MHQFLIWWVWNIWLYIYDGKCYTMNNNFSIKGTKIDSYCTHKRLQGRGETQGKKRRDLSGENYLGSTAQLIVASGNEIFCFQRTASLLIHWLAEVHSSGVWITRCLPNKLSLNPWSIPAQSSNRTGKVAKGGARAHRGSGAPVGQVMDAGAALHSVPAAGKFLDHCVCACAGQGGKGRVGSELGLGWHSVRNGDVSQGSWIGALSCTGCHNLVITLVMTFILLIQ